MSSPRLLRNALLVLLFFLFPLPAAPTQISGAEPAWQELEPGLHLGRFMTSEDGAIIDALRINPAFFSFSLHCGGASDALPRTITEWAEQENLALAINAGMYLPDRITSTGYMRSGNYVNNPRIHNKFGAFFVAEPTAPGLPPAAVLDREHDRWEDLLGRYSVVIQNYRLIDIHGRVLWLDGGPQHSCAAVGQDTEGSILFIHCRTPLSGRDFAAALLRLPLKLRSLMYVEGGAQAGMLVRAPKLQRLWAGYSSIGFLTLNDQRVLPLPNVLGARRRNADNPPATKKQE